MPDASSDGSRPAPQWKRIVLKLSGEADLTTVAELTDTFVVRDPSRAP